MFFFFFHLSFYSSGTAYFLFKKKKKILLTSINILLKAQFWKTLNCRYLLSSVLYASVYQPVSGFLVTLSLVQLQLKLIKVPLGGVFCFGLIIDVICQWHSRPGLTLVSFLRGLKWRESPRALSVSALSPAPLPSKYFVKSLIFQSPALQRAANQESAFLRALIPRFHSFHFRRPLNKYVQSGPFFSSQFISRLFILNEYY